MRSVILSFLCLFLFSFLTIAQDNCQGKQLPYGASIAGQTDSITVEAFLQAGKIQCINPAFKVLNFRLGNSGLYPFCYSEVHCSSDSLSPMAIAFVKRMAPGSRLFLDCVRVKNRVGDTFLLKSHVFRIRSK